jgi:putative DNA primase/helicase
LARHEFPRDDPGFEGDTDRWQVLDEELHKIERDTTVGARLLRRSLDLLPVTNKNIKTFSAAAGRFFGNQRDGDQYGTLLAGAWSLISSREATYAEAEALIKKYDWAEHVDANVIDEPTRARTALLGARIRHQGGDVTVHELVTAAAGLATEGLTIDHKAANAVLKRHGMRVLIEPGARADRRAAPAIDQRGASKAPARYLIRLGLEGAAKARRRRQACRAERQG